MSILDSAISDSMDPAKNKGHVPPEEDTKIADLKTLGIPITEKK